MEFIKLIAPYLPLVVVAYMLVDCRYLLLALFELVRKKLIKKKIL